MQNIIYVHNENGLKKDSQYTKTVQNYINGNDISEYSIDELENNIEFMLEVLATTKDEKMYNFCSEELKNNYQFIKKTILIFKNNIDFITSLANDYIKKHQKNENECKELNILMTDLLEKSEIDDVLIFNTHAYIFYSSMMSSISILKNRPENNDIKDEVGEGWTLIEDEYNDSEIIKEYFAKRIITNIFYNTNDFLLEKALHKKASTKEEITDDTITKIIIDIINEKDFYLAKYANSNKHILTEIQKIFKKFILSWNTFENRYIKEKIDIFYEKVENFLEENDQELRDNYKYFEYIDFAVKKLNIEDIFIKHDPSWVIPQINNDSFPQPTLDINELTIKEIKALKYIIKIAKDLFIEDKDYFKKTIEDIKYNKKTKTQSKIIPIPLKK